MVTCSVWGRLPASDLCDVTSDKQSIFQKGNPFKIFLLSRSSLAFLLSWTSLKNPLMKAVSLVGQRFKGAEHDCQSERPMPVQQAPTKFVAVTRSEGFLSQTHEVHQEITVMETMSHGKCFPFERNGIVIVTSDQNRCFQ